MEETKGDRLTSCTGDPRPPLMMPRDKSTDHSATTKHHFCETNRQKETKKETSKIKADKRI